tara:strand:- start:3102 stop:3368 length:267 start_codon:yes stop_codon:yes gene_type:complete
MTTQEEQMIQHGDEAEQILGSSAFSATVNELVDEAFKAFVNTEPHETEKREETYRHYRALVDVVNHFKHKVAVRDSIKEQGDTSQEED